MRALASAACGSESVTPTARTPWYFAAWMINDPQPQPRSSNRSSGVRRSFWQMSSSLRCWALARSSSGVAKYAQEYTSDGPNSIR
jgi:hypothetical protein